VVETHLRHLLPGLRIEVQQFMGREGLIAWNEGAGGGGAC